MTSLTQMTKDAQKNIENKNEEKYMQMINKVEKIIESYFNKAKAGIKDYDLNKCVKNGESKFVFSKYDVDYKLSEIQQLLQNLFIDYSEFVYDILCKLCNKEKVQSNVQEENHYYIQIDENVQFHYSFLKREHSFWISWSN